MTITMSEPDHVVDPYSSADGEEVSTKNKNSQLMEEVMSTQTTTVESVVNGFHFTETKRPKERITEGLLVAQ